MPPSPPVKRRQKRPQSSLLARTWWVALVVVALAAGLAPLLFRTGGRSGELEGYISDPAALRREYRRFYGKPLDDAEAQRKFGQASDSMRKHDWPAATKVLEEVARVAAVPVVFNDLGVLYAQMEDRGRAAKAFQEAISRDTSSVPVRQNLRRLQGFLANAADPVTHEIEPNNSKLNANRIALDAPVDGEIDGASQDADLFTLNAPPPPRDLLRVEVVSRAPGFAPGLRIYDGDFQPVGSESPAAIAPAPNAALYIEVVANGSAGLYTLHVRRMRAFDTFEPNDQIVTAHPLEPGVTAGANIMDEHDTDFYSFQSRRDGIVSIRIVNRSEMLIPALTTFSPDLRTSGFGPDVRTPGAGLSHKIPVVAGMTYFLQVWSQANTSGEYAITVE